MLLSYVIVDSAVNLQSDVFEMSRVFHVEVEQGTVACVAQALQYFHHSRAEHVVELSEMSTAASASAIRLNRP